MNLIYGPLLIRYNILRFKKLASKAIEEYYNINSFDYRIYIAYY